MKISIIIPVINEEVNLASALEHLQFIRQQGHEIVVVDGGSKDNSFMLAQEGADIVIAVNLNGDLLGRHRKLTPDIVEPDNSVTGKLTELVREYSSSLFPHSDVEVQPPGLLDAIAGSINITQDRITRSRMAGDPADIILLPRLADIGLLEIYRADESITEGQKCVQRKISEINCIFETI